jgi:hypothetical protein
MCTKGQSRLEKLSAEKVGPSTRKSCDTENTTVCTICCVSHCIEFNFVAISCTSRLTVSPTMKILKRGRCRWLTVCKSSSRKLPITIHDSNIQQSYFNPGKKLQPEWSLGYMEVVV